MARWFDDLASNARLRALWAVHAVAPTACPTPPGARAAPTAGEMTLSRQVLSLPDADGQVVLAYFAEPGTASAAALASLDA